jgi:hypothetical protein|uniref:hypothetical protein n=1 Tax=Gemmiger formicilis TaxID=745368 RepID=UPI004029F98B
MYVPAWRSQPGRLRSGFCMASLPLCPVPCFLRRLLHRTFSKKPFLLQNHERFFTNLLKSSY